MGAQKVVGRGPGNLIKVFAAFAIGFAIAIGITQLVHSANPHRHPHDEPTHSAHTLVHSLHLPAGGLHGHHLGVHQARVEPGHAYHNGQALQEGVKPHLRLRGGFHHQLGGHHMGHSNIQHATPRPTQAAAPPPPPPAPAAVNPPRECGSPAVDGYAHVKPECLEHSATAVIWKEWVAAGHQAAELACSVEEEADFDGLAVAWGPFHKKASAEECMEACRVHRPGPHVGGPFQNLPCNSFTWCPHEECFEPDAHHHTRGDCWLKFTEAPQSPELNMRGSLEDSLMKRHAKAPRRTPWSGGVCLLPGMVLTNGTWGPRYSW